MSQFHRSPTGLSLHRFSIVNPICPQRDRVGSTSMSVGLPPSALPVNTAMDGVPGRTFRPVPGTSPWARADLDVARRALNACVDKDFE